jgi:hypothetical protein
VVAQQILAVVQVAGIHLVAAGVLRGQTAQVKPEEILSGERPVLAVAVVEQMAALQPQAETLYLTLLVGRGVMGVAVQEGALQGVSRLEATLQRVPAVAVAVALTGLTVEQLPKITFGPTI